MAKFRVFENQKEQIFLIFIIISVLSFKTIAAARDCCPENTYLEGGTKMCSDNKTYFDLNCSNGTVFLDYILSEKEDLLKEPHKNFSLFEEEIPPEDKCFSNGSLLLEFWHIIGRNSFISLIIPGLHLLGVLDGKIRRNGTDRLVALICFEEERVSVFDIIRRILMLFSTLLLLVTFCVYMVLPNLKGLQEKCVCAFIGCLISSYITILVLEIFPSSSDLECVIQAFTLYFSISATFFWNNIITFNIWKSVRNASHKIKQKSLSLIYLLWGFGIPALMVAISFILDHVPGGSHIRPHFGEIRCWFRGKIESWSYFYGPISVLLLLNTIMFLQCVWILWRRYKVSNDSKLRSIRFKYVMYLRLFLIMGITWTFEVASFATSSVGKMKYIWLITDYLNSAQGILIFLILVVFRQKVRRKILKSKLFKINWPKSWTREEIEESSTASLAEEFELPNQKSKIIIESQK